MRQSLLARCVESVNVYMSVLRCQPALWLRSSTVRPVVFAAQQLESFINCDTAIDHRVGRALFFHGGKSVVPNKCQSVR
jgi:hypothetical protein